MRVFAPLLTMVLFAACATTGESDGGSSVEYLMLTSGGTRTVVAPARRSGSGGGVVRVEPIRRDGSVARANPQLPRSVTASAIDVHPGPVERDHEPAFEPRTAPGAKDVVLPYPVQRIFRGFGACRGNRHYHEAIDIGGLGPDQGIGTPIRSMGRARVTLIGRGSDDPGEFGRPDTRGGTVKRGGHELPRSKVVDGYGKVYFFTRDRGRWRSGDVVVTVGMGGPLDGHEARYMHLGAVRPGLKVGDIVEAGEELGLLGGTGVQESSPHLHLDVENPEGEKIDVAPLLGLEATARECPEPSAAGNEARVWTRAATLPRCGKWEREEDFASGEYYAHDVLLTLEKGQKINVALQQTGGRWHPQIAISDGDGTTVYNGSSATRAGQGGPLKVTRRESGKKSERAAVIVEAKERTTLTVRVTAWPSERAGLLLPKDGAYALSVETACDS